MKKIAYLLVFILITISFSNKSYAQCPPGYYGPFITNINLCGDNCRVGNLMVLF